MSSGYFVLSVVFEPLSELVNVWCKYDCISEEENIPRFKIIFLCYRGLEKSMPPSSDRAPPTRPAGCLPLGLHSRASQTIWERAKETHFYKPFA